MLAHGLIMHHLVGCANVYLKNHSEKMRMTTI